MYETANKKLKFLIQNGLAPKEDKETLLFEAITSMAKQECMVELERYNLNDLFLNQGNFINIKEIMKKYFLLKQFDFLDSLNPAYITRNKERIQRDFSQLLKTDFDYLLVSDEDLYKAFKFRILQINVHIYDYSDTQEEKRLKRTMQTFENECFEKEIKKYSLSYHGDYSRTKETVELKDLWKKALELNLFPKSFRTRFYKDILPFERDSLTLRKYTRTAIRDIISLIERGLFSNLEVEDILDQI